MNKIWLGILLLPLILCEGCNRRQYRQIEGKIYGTYYRIVYESDRDMGGELLKEINGVNSSLSMFDTSSVLSRINRNVSDEMDTLTARVITTAYEVFRQTGGAFDMTVAPLVNAWGFGYKNDRLPSKEKIDSLLLLTGMDKLSVNGNRLIKKDPAMEIDAGAIAKGLGVDVAADFLEATHTLNYMVDIGGEVRVKGNSAKQRPWRIGIDKPMDNLAPEGPREIQLILSLSEGAMATSGNYRNFYVHDGKKYAHTIDPRTGYPVQRDILSATVYASSCMLADAYATSFMVLGFDESRKVVEKTPELQACLIYEEEGEIKVWMTDYFKTFVLE
ncbi:FAD:protein FMN transferase [Odoribacter sp. OttesenSCG-928-J03]|nr:FAD:protein FMN transferase [Odoribacter sp. OttesenSCG-928-J03]MDL2283498.1 FAD:protein FMN transferase [Odoribacter sp. OttesenSCG-928-G04]